MEEKYRDNISKLLDYISADIEKLVDEDYEDLIDAIFILARNVSKVSEEIYDNDIVYERPAGRIDYRFSLD